MSHGASMGIAGLLAHDRQYGGLDVVADHDGLVGLSCRCRRCSSDPASLAAGFIWRVPAPSPPLRQSRAQPLFRRRCHRACTRAAALHLAGLPARSSGNPACVLSLTRSAGVGATQSRRRIDRPRARGHRPADPGVQARAGPRPRRQHRAPTSRSTCAPRTTPRSRPSWRRKPQRAAPRRRPFFIGRQEGRRKDQGGRRAAGEPAEQDGRETQTEALALPRRPLAQATPPPEPLEGAFGPQQEGLRSLARPGRSRTGPGLRGRSGGPLVRSGSRSRRTRS